MNKNKHLLLWSSLGVSALLVAAAVRRTSSRSGGRSRRRPGPRAGRSTCACARSSCRSLRVTDRCVSCHVGMAPGEQGLTGPKVVSPHKPVGHDPAEFGCTVCHGGQGRATEKADAHGDVPFWPEPMIPSRFAYAGCGTCHTHLSVPQPSATGAGTDSRGTLRLPGLPSPRRPRRHAAPGGAGGMEGPDLSRVGAAGYRPRNGTKNISTNRSKPPRAPGKLRSARSARPTAQPSTSFSRSRVGAPGLVEAKAMFHSLGCRGCHKVGGVGGDDGPDLTLEGKKDPGRLDFTPRARRTHAGQLAGRALPPPRPSSCPARRCRPWGSPRSKSIC